ncbi:amidohydrolase, partial [Bacillus vallismortis]|nr:amidohydrolase [Bacillus vallismortis]
GEKGAQLKFHVEFFRLIALPYEVRFYNVFSVLLGYGWGFGFDTATHAFRLMLIGLCYVSRSLPVILGQLGVGLLFKLPRVEHRL